MTFLSSSLTWPGRQSGLLGLRPACKNTDTCVPRRSQPSMSADPRRVLRSSLSSKNASSSRSMLRWWKSAVNLSFFLSLATFRMRSSACDTFARLCVRCVLCWPAFPLVPVLGYTGSAAGCSALFASFAATMTESDFSWPCIIGYGSSPSRYGPPHPAPTTRRRPATRYPSFRRDPARDVAFDPNNNSLLRRTKMRRIGRHLGATR
jgi:hypothetical protein